LATIPFLGLYVLMWLWGGDYINDFTILKLHSLHIILPFVCVFLLIMHFFCLHFYMSSDGFCDRFVFYCERLCFMVWFYLRDVFIFLVVCFFLWLFCVIYWYFVYHEESWFVVDCLKAADKILPEWFFLLFFGFLKSIPDKFMGFFGLFVFVLFFFCVGFKLFVFVCVVPYDVMLVFVLFMYGLIVFDYKFFGIGCCVMFSMMNRITICCFIFVLYNCFTCWLMLK